MKLSTLLQRLAAKTSTPGLPSMVAGKLPWPLECMHWTGATTVKGPRLKLGRDSEGRPFKYMAQTTTYGRIAADYAHRILYALANPDATGFKIRSSCGVPLCVNPLHWEPVLEEIPEALYEPDAPWTYDEAENAVERYIANRDPIYLEDVPPDLLLQAFTRIGKLHLMPVGLAGAPPQGL